MNVLEVGTYRHTHTNVTDKGNFSLSATPIKIPLLREFAGHVRFIPGAHTIILANHVIYIQCDR